jgi:hypothetical protein
VAAAHRVLSATGRLSWFEVHDTIEEAMTGASRLPPASAPTREPGRLQDLRRSTGMTWLSSRRMARLRQERRAGREIPSPMLAAG